MSCLDLEKDFEVFNQRNLAESSITTPRPLPSTQVSIDQEITDVPEAMVLQCKNTSLLELLESHARGSTLEEAVQPCPPNPLPTHISYAKPLEKKWKIEKKGKETFKEGEVPLSKDL